MKKIITLALILTLLILSSYTIIARGGCFDLDYCACYESVSNSSGEWTVMIISIIALSIMTGGIVYMTTKSWDGKKSDTSDEDKE